MKLFWAGEEATRSLSRVFRVETGGSVWIPAFQADDEPFETGREEVLEQARYEALAIRRQAEKEAALVVENAELKAVEYRKQSEKAGFDEGFKSGLHTGLNEAQSLVDQAGQILEASKNARARYVEQAEPKLLALVLEVARKVVGESLSYDPELIISMLRQGIEAIGDERRFSLRVNPKLVAFIEGGKEGLQRQFGAEIVEVIGDHSISAGAIVETSHGQIDATIDTQIENLAKAIGEARNCAGEHDL